MPAVPSNPPTHSRQQTVIGQARVIDDAARLARDPGNRQIANADVVRKAHGLQTAAATLEAKPNLRGIVIEKNVPIPPRRRGAALPSHQMQVNDSFFVLMSPQGAYGACRKAAASTGWTFIARNVEEDGVKGVRIWRTA
jgi:hypothetical protein